MRNTMGCGCVFLGGGGGRLVAGCVHGRVAAVVVGGLGRPGRKPAWRRPPLHSVGCWHFSTRWRGHVLCSARPDVIRNEQGAATHIYVHKSNTAASETQWMSDAAAQAKQSESTRHEKKHESRQRHLQNATQQNKPMRAHSVTRNWLDKRGRVPAMVVRALVAGDRRPGSRRSQSTSDGGLEETAILCGMHGTLTAGGRVSSPHCQAHSGSSMCGVVAGRSKRSPRL